MNAMTSRLNLRVDQPGDYMGLASHLSGAGFSTMPDGTRAIATILHPCPAPHCHTLHLLLPTPQFSMAG